MRLKSLQCFVFDHKLGLGGREGGKGVRGGGGYAKTRIHPSETRFPMKVLKKF